MMMVIHMMKTCTSDRVHTHDHLGILACTLQLPPSRIVIKFDINLINDIIKIIIMEIVIKMIIINMVWIIIMTMITLAGTYPCWQPHVSLWFGNGSHVEWGPHGEGSPCDICHNLPCLLWQRNIIIDSIQH